MAEDDRRISLAGKVLVDTIDAQLLESNRWRMNTSVPLRNTCSAPPST